MKQTLLASGLLLFLAIPAVLPTTAEAHFSGTDGTFLCARFNRCFELGLIDEEDLTEEQAQDIEELYCKEFVEWLEADTEETGGMGLVRMMFACGHI